MINTEDEMDQTEKPQEISLPNFAKTSSNMKNLSVVVMLLACASLMMSVVFLKAVPVIVFLFMGALVSIMFFLQGLLLFSQAKNAEMLENIIDLVRESKNARN